MILRRQRERTCSLRKKTWRVGNIYTRRDLRRRGYARQAAIGVLNELVERGVGTICLNVAIENEGALALYRSMGFEIHSEYFEGQAVRE